MSLKFSQCPKCAAKGSDRKMDNLAEYENGFYCFSCGYRKDKRNLSRFNASKSDKVYKDISFIKSLPECALKWLLGYQLTAKEMEQFTWNEEKQLLGLLKTENYWVGRSFHPEAKIKYLSSGVKPFKIYEAENNNDVVLVEDVISAVKVSRVANSVPMLGSSLNKDYYSRLLCFDNVYLWGDADKATQNVKIARQMTENLGKEVKFIYTKKDPKEFNTTEIKLYLN